MSTYLLDVNLLVALAWPGHTLHPTAERWFLRKGSQAWATCPFTQAGFVRLLSNPHVVPGAVSPVEAVLALRESTQLPEHHFWPDDLLFADAIDRSGIRLIGFKQVTDAYLLGLAVRKNGVLATLDAKTATLVSDGSRASAHLEVVR
ncbi:MAG TPA: TA system VapC family ribonuclease toxin [Terriglobales bacterium]|jgi:hypothetical protein